TTYAKEPLNSTSADGTARTPNLSFKRLIFKSFNRPLSFCHGTANNVKPRDPSGAPSIRAKTMATPHIPAFEAKYFSPYIRYWSPALIAFTRFAPTSDPPSRSVKNVAPSYNVNSPVVQLSGQTFSFIPSFPYSSRH